MRTIYVTTDTGRPAATTPAAVARAIAAPAVEADVLVIGIRPDQAGPSTATKEGKEGAATGTAGITLADGSAEVDAAFDGVLAETLVTLGATGRAEEITLLPSGGRLAAPVVAAVGLGPANAAGIETLRRAAGAVVRRLNGKATGIAFALTSTDQADQAGPAEIAAIAEGALLGAYRFERYHTNSANAGRRGPTSIIILTGQPPTADVTEALGVADVGARAVNLARDWVNTAPSDLYPESFAAIATAEAERVGIDIEVLDEQELRAGGFGALIGVGQGSARGPRMVRLAYRYPNAEQTLAFVGKGITFDSGGLSLKPNDGMKTMKCDMSGAAAVVAAVLAIAELELQVNVIGYAALAENMPSSTAQRPSDVVTTYGGKTIEVLNTDAEGRLVLADALGRATEDAPNVIIDVATLTGAVVIALGERTFGVMSNDDALRDAVGAAAEQSGEDAWPLPIPEGIEERIESKVADIANVGSARTAGALTAAAFLREFVPPGTPWAHLDIAGPAFNDGAAWGYTPNGGTGSAVRTLIRFAASR